MTATETGPVTVIGLGVMGHTLAASLLARGFAVILWNRSAEKAAALVDQGAVLAPGVPEALAAAAPLAIVCLSDQEVTWEVLSGEAVRAAAAGKTLIQLSTVTSAESLELADWAAGAGAGYLDGQILSFPDDVREARANIVYSGPRDLFDRHAALLSAMAGNAHHVGERNGAAASFDKAHLSFAMGSYLAFLQGAAMCARAGVDLRAWCDFNLRHVESGAVARELAILADQICTRAYDEGMEATLEVWQGALAKTVEECAALGADKAHLAPLDALVDSAVDAGFGGQELAVIFERMIPGKTE